MTLLGPSKWVLVQSENLEASAYDTSNSPVRTMSPAPIGAVRTPLLQSLKHRQRYHLVFVPKYRKRVLEGKVAARLEQLLRQACEVNRWNLEELAIQPDHVHLLVQIQPKWRVSDVVQKFKGGTSRILRSEFPELAKFLWGVSLWADGYFAATVGVVEGSVITEYIRAQQRYGLNPYCETNIKV